jgi:hypothetical protein
MITRKYIIKNYLTGKYYSGNNNWKERPLAKMFEFETEIFMLMATSKINQFQIELVYVNRSSNKNNRREIKKIVQEKI